VAIRTVTITHVATLLCKQAGTQLCFHGQLVAVKSHTVRCLVVKRPQSDVVFPPCRLTVLTVGQHGINKPLSVVYEFIWYSLILLQTVVFHPQSCSDVDNCSIFVFDVVQYRT